LDKLTPEIKEAVMKVCKNNRLSCAAAHKLAAELGVPVRTIGNAADELKIKIVACQLGCFE